MAKLCHLLGTKPLGLKVPGSPSIKVTKRRWAGIPWKDSLGGFHDVQVRG